MVCKRVDRDARSASGFVRIPAKPDVVRLGGDGQLAVIRLGRMNIMGYLKQN